MRISDVAFRGFPPFAEGSMTFPPAEQKDGEPKFGEVQFITGQNGTGKTRLLSLFAAALGNKAELMRRIPEKNAYRAFVQLSNRTLMGIWGSRNEQGLQETLLGVADQLKGTLLDLAKGKHTLDRIGFQAAYNSAIDWPSAQNTLSLAYRGTVRAKDAKINAMSPLDFGKLPDHLIFDRDEKESTLICQSMANLKLQAAMEGQSGLTDFSRATIMTQALEKTLTTITGRRFAFIINPMPDLHLRVIWGNESMRIEMLPDGLRAIIGWLVSCIAKLDAKYPDNPKPLDLPLIILLDEPESHLHPTWQRKLIPAAQMLFPNSQIFVATHSPFIIYSVNHNGWIHILKADEKGEVRAEQPRPCSQGDSWIEVVEEILGVTEWYDPETEEKIQNLKSLKNEVLAGRKSLDDFKNLATEIAGRGASLHTIMSREIKQMERQLQPKAIAS